MRWSKLFAPTLKEDPANAESLSHRLLLRGGYIRPLGSGIYSLLPLAQRVRNKVIDLIRFHLDNIGAQEFVLPASKSYRPRRVIVRAGASAAKGIRSPPV